MRIFSIARIRWDQAGLRRGLKESRYRWNPAALAWWKPGRDGLSTATVVLCRPEERAAVAAHLARTEESFAPFGERDTGIWDDTPLGGRDGDALLVPRAGAEN